MTRTNDVWTELVEIARFAPTPHNTQPFRVRPRDAASAEVLLVTERLLPEEDRNNAYMASAFGVFADTLERAGAALGLEVVVRADEAAEPSAWRSRATTCGVHDASRTGGERVRIGFATIEGRRAALPDERARIEDARRTSRLPYDGRAVPAAALKRLGEVCARHGHAFVVESSASAIAEILAWNASAIVDNLQIPRERRELEGWYRTGDTPEVGDGLWNVPLAQPAWEVKLAFAAPWLLKAPVLGDLAAARYVDSQRGTPHVAFIRGPFLSWPELVAAGRALMDLWLTMTDEGIFVHPLGSMLTNPEYAARVARHVGHDDVWLLFRMGYSAKPPRAPRLCAAEVIVHE
jgi:hypothetical protein